MYNILVLDDEKEIADLVELSLKNDNYKIYKFTNSKEAIECINTVSLDMAILDVMLPGMNGFEVASKLRKDGFNSPILMLTALDADEDKIKGLDAGADDYVTKPFSTEVLLARIRANLRRSEMDGVSSSKPQTYGDLTLDPENNTASVKGQTLKLRSKELALLFALAERQGMLCRRTWLTQKVWKEDYLSTSRTIDVHVRRLRSVLDEVSDYRFIHTVHGMGYRFEPVKKNEE